MKGIALAVGVICGAPVLAADLPPVAMGVEPVSADAQQIVGWIGETGDNKGRSFILIDKRAAKVFAINSEGRLVGAAPVLPGVAIGDEIPAGIANLPLSAIKPAQRITPAGRFVAEMGENQAGKAILWVDYEASIAIHPVVTTNPAEHRLNRLTSPSPSDNRISFGCINVPEQFFQKIVAPLFQQSGGIVYILPETRAVNPSFFASAGAAPPGRRLQASNDEVEATLTPAR